MNYPFLLSLSLILVGPFSVVSSAVAQTAEHKMCASLKKDLSLSVVFGAGTLLNSGCAIRCNWMAILGRRPVEVEHYTLNEGQQCPDNAQGICHAGKCTSAVFANAPINEATGEANFCDPLCEPECDC